MGYRYEGGGGGSGGGTWDGDITDADIAGGTDIGADLADSDLLIVDDGATGTVVKSALSRFWTYILAKIVAVTDVSTHGWVVDEDNMVSDLATKVPTQQSVKAYVDANGGGNLSTTDIDTLAELNAIITDATLIDTGDSRLSDVRTPTSHAASHTDGTDDIQSATNAQKGLATAAHITAIEANTAKLTADATNVNAAGATMNADTDVSANGWVVDEDNMASDLATKVPTQQSVKAYVDAEVAAVTVTPPAKLLSFLAGSFYMPTTNPAPLERDIGTNGFLYRHLFDDTTQEYIEGLFVVPNDIGTGNVTFRTLGYAVTAAASKNIQLSFEHSAKADSESWDAAYTAEDSGDLATDATQDQIDAFTWTETVANLGWTAGDIVRFKLSRKAPGSNNLTGDYGVNLFTISIPRV